MYSTPYHVQFTSHLPPYTCADVPLPWKHGGPHVQTGRHGARQQPEEGQSAGQPSGRIPACSYPLPCSYSSQHLFTTIKGLVEYRMHTHNCVFLRPHQCTHLCSCFHTVMHRITATHLILTERQLMSWPPAISDSSQKGQAAPCSPTACSPSPAQAYVARPRPLPNSAKP